MTLRPIQAVMEDVMDSLTAKMVKSREKSIATLTKECEELQAKVASATVAASRQAWEGVLLVKRQRLERLQAELAAFLQPELPLASSSDHPAAGPVGGRSRQGPTKTS